MFIAQILQPCKSQLALRYPKHFDHVVLEADLDDFSRITVDPARMGGVPCIRNLRIPVASVVGAVADGMAGDEILAAYPDLEPEDIRAALRFAAWAGISPSVMS